MLSHFYYTVSAPLQPLSLKHLPGGASKVPGGLQRNAKKTISPNPKLNLQLHLWAVLPVHSSDSEHLSGVSAPPNTLLCTWQMSSVLIEKPLAAVITYCMFNPCEMRALNPRLRTHLQPGVQMRRVLDDLISIITCLVVSRCWCF